MKCGYRAVGLHHGGLHLKWILIAGAAQPLQQIRQAQAQAVQRPLVDDAALDHNRRLTRNHRPKAIELQAQQANDPVHHDDRRHRQQSVQQRRGYAAHGLGNDVCQQDRQRQLERLEFAQLTLAQQAHGQYHHTVEQHAAQK